MGLSLISSAGCLVTMLLLLSVKSFTSKAVAQMTGAVDEIVIGIDWLIFRYEVVN